MGQIRGAMTIRRAL